MIPFLTLVGCNKNSDGNQISKEEAANVASAIKAKQKVSNNLILNFKQSGTMEDEQGRKIPTTTNADLKINEDGEFDLLSKVTQNNEVKEYHVYNVKHPTYQGVLYVKEGTNVTVVAQSLDAATYNFSLAMYEMSVGMVKGVAQSYVDPTGIVSEATEDFKFFTKGEGNLTIKVHQTNPSASQSETEVMAEGDYTIRYDNFDFKNVYSSSKSNKGSESQFDLVYAAQESKIAITLPAGWENYLNPNA